jgi:hypothetical protein
MITDKWIHPAGIDYSDAWNPVAKRGYNENNNRYVYDSWQDPIFQALRQAIGVEGRLWVCPTPEAQLVPALTTIDFQVPAEPNTWLLGYSAVSNPGSTPDPAGFQFQITDSLTGATVFSSPLLASLVYPGSPNLPGIIKYLSAPRLYVPPAYPTVRIVNNSASPQTCVVYLWCAIETDVQPIP